MGKVKLFSEESKRWILENHCSAETVKCFTARYNREFNECRSKGTMKHCLRKLGLKQDDRKFSKEEDSWLLAHAPSLSVDETAKQFNAFFRENRSAQVLKARCNRFLNIKHKHDRSGRAMSVGSEITNTNGFVFVKVDNKKSAGFYQNWKQKHQIVWEQHNGKIPPGHKVIFLDRNRSNCSIENLYIVDGKVMREMSKKKWFSDIPEITLTAIKWCEMFYAIKQVDSQSSDIVQKGLNMNRNYIGKRVRVVGDHPHKGQTGKVVSIERTLAGDGYKIELDDKSTASACFVFSMLEMMLLNERG